MSYGVRGSCVGVGVVCEGGSRRAGSFAKRGVGLNGRLAVVVGGTMTELADLGMAWL